MKISKGSPKKGAKDLEENGCKMCCSPYIATVVAGILTLLQSIGGLSWNFPVLFNITWNKTDVMSIASLNIQDADNVIQIYGTALVFAFLNCQLLLFSLLLLKSNSESKIEWMRGWCSLILVRSSAEVILGFYYFNKYSSPLDISTDTYYRLAVLSSGIFFFWPMTNMIFAAMVFKRTLDLAIYYEGLLRAGKIAEQLGLIAPPHYVRENEESGEQTPLCSWPDMRYFESPFGNDPLY